MLGTARYIHAILVVADLELEDIGPGKDNAGL